MILQPISGFYHGLRRCLEFEMAGANKSSAEGTALDIMPLAAVKQPGDDSSSTCIMPGIGLHLNTVGKNSGDHKHENFVTEARVTDMRISPVSLKFPKSAHVPPYGSLTSEVSQMAEEGLLLSEDNSRAHARPISEELNQGSPKRKRQVQNCFRMSLISCRLVCST